MKIETYFSARSKRINPLKFKPDSPIAEVLNIIVSRSLKHAMRAR
jgi:hypothetical protein